MGEKTFVPNYLKKTLEGTTVGGGVDLYDDDYITKPKGKISISKGKTTIEGGVGKGFSKKDKRNINSEISLGISRGDESSSFTLQGSKQGKSKNLGFSFQKTFKSGGLNKWFKENWVDISSPKKGGGYKKCGRKSASGSKRGYPKCVPAAKAARMTESERRSAVARKRSKAQGVGGKPTNVKTFASKGGMPERNKKNFRSTESGAGMTEAGVKAYRRMNPGSKLKTAVTGKVKPGSKDAKRRKSYCARSLGQLKRASAKTRNDPNSRIRQARRRWKC